MESISEKRIVYDGQSIPQQQVGIVQNQAAFNGQLQYGTPIIIGNRQGSGIVVNQGTSAIVVNPGFVLGTVPVSILCPFCKRPITTIVEKNFNCGTCLLCWCTGLLLFICIQSCSGKEIGCCDAVHKCPNCGNVVGEYSSC